jgi:sialidase-1
MNPSIYLRIFFLECLLFLGQLEAHCQQRTSLPSGQTLFTSAESSVACYRIPALAVAPNGDLLAVADERVPDCGDLRTNRNINLVMRRSSDKGNSWSEIERIIDFPDGMSASDPSLITDRVSGEICLFYNFMDLDTAPGIYRLHLVRSRDNGKSWSKPEDISPQITKPEWQKDFMFITSGGGIQTSSGKLVNTLVNLPQGLFVFTSDDHGKSWYLMEQAIRPADESKIVELSDGSWMINSRVNGAGFRYVYHSADQGLNWTGGPDSSLYDPGCNAGLISCPLQDEGQEKKLLVLSYLDDQHERKNLRMRTSMDDGKSWSAGKVIYEGSAGYSALTVLPGEEIGLLFEKDDYREIVFIRFTTDSIYPGK